MKKLIEAGFFAAAIALFASHLASAQEVVSMDYGSNNMGGSAYLTWGFRQGGEPGGYACLVRDTLEGMTHDAYIHRYAVVPVPDSYYAELQPLNAVNIIPAENGRGYVVRESEVIPVEDIWNNAELDEQGDWFLDDLSVDELGKACIDGGVAGAIQRLEQSYGTRFQR